MIPKKPAPDLIRGGNRFSEKHALGLDSRDHAQTKDLALGNRSYLEAWIPDSLSG
jgi:hypothetical protein